MNRENQMQPEGSEKEPRAVCRAMQELLVFYAADEIDDAERRKADAHLRECASCAARLAEEQEFLAVVSSSQSSTPDVQLLASCRAQFAGVLDQEEVRHPANWLANMFGRSWFGMRLAVSAALLLIVGFLAGRMASLRHVQNISSISGGAANSLTAAGQANPSELRTADIAAITSMPSSGDAPPDVQVQMANQRSVLLQGTVNNDKVKNALLSVLENQNRYQPDVRMQSVDLLKPRCADADVSQAMCRVLHSDRNAGVRLKALEALGGAPPSENVEQAMLDALRGDSNPGVRVEAVQSLLKMARNGQSLRDPQDIQILRDRMQRDPNNYVRLQTAALVQNLEPHQ
jgi:HEAT repeats/Putative zinc-finger